jgi:hypothetical protein
MVLTERSGRKTALNFVTPTHWQIGDTVLMQINRNPYDLQYENGVLVVLTPPEPPNGWMREFYSLFNERTRDTITFDFDSVDRQASAGMEASERISGELAI